MFERLRRNIGLRWTNFHFRHDRDAIVTFTDAIPRASRALVIYPDQPPDQESSTFVLSYLSERFGDGLTLVVRQDIRTSLFGNRHLRMVTYNQEDVTRWFTPRNGLIRRLKSPFDVALDLNEDFSLIGAFLCRASRAPLRISFAKEHGERFFNIQFKIQPSTRRLRQYQGLVRCLKMFERT